MRITYWANLKEKKYPTKEITNALKKLNNDVMVIDDQDFDIGKLVEEANKRDLFLFHQGGVITEQDFDFQLTVSRLQNILQNIKCSKVMWLLDKVWGLGDPFVEQIASFVDYGFFNDDNWVRRHTYPHFYPLHCGTEKRPLGKYRKDFDVDIAFIGSVYGTRQMFFENLRQQFGRKFKIFQNVWDSDFDDVCCSAKIIVAPSFPEEDFYWSDRIYKVLGAGGFLLHPRLQGLIEEGWVSGRHYVHYKTWNEFLLATEYFLNPEHEQERKEIAEDGRKRALEKFTYEKRLKQLLNQIHAKYENKGK